MNKVARILPFGLYALPVLVGAQSLTFFTAVTDKFGEVVSALVPIVIALAFVVFVWGLITFILASGDEAAKDEGKRRMIWGVLALFVIVSIWGIIELLQKFTGTTANTASYPDWKTS